MRVVLAPDSFKGTLSAIEVCAHLEKAVRRHFPEALVHSIPLADGGEGTVEAVLHACDGERQTVCVDGPYGERVQAGYALLCDGTAVCEMAAASGITLSSRREPLLASSVGTGQMLLHLLKSTKGKVLLGLGGSATNDGGVGFLYALGVRFFDADDSPVAPRASLLSQIKRVDLSGLAPIKPELSRITVLCDVKNPLCGPDGATAIYGPQKGVTEETYPLLEEGLLSFSRVLSAALGRDVAAFSGAGAAGGMGMALGGVLQAAIRPGIDEVLSISRFEEKLSQADLCITGEGRFDGQSVRYGKALAGIASRCAEKDVPLCIVAGGLGEGAEEIYRICPCTLCVTPNRPMPLEDALANAEILLDSAADRLLRTLKMGMNLQRRTEG